MIPQPDLSKPKIVFNKKIRKLHTNLVEICSIELKTDPKKCTNLLKIANRSTKSSLEPQSRMHRLITIVDLTVDREAVT
jgi:hypothetical protein